MVPHGPPPCTRLGGYVTRRPCSLRIFRVTPATNSTVSVLVPLLFRVSFVFVVRINHFKVKSMPPASNWCDHPCCFFQARETRDVNTSDRRTPPLRNMSRDPRSSTNASRLDLGEPTMEIDVRLAHAPRDLLSTPTGLLGNTRLADETSTASVSRDVSRGVLTLAQRADHQQGVGGVQLGLLTSPTSTESSVSSLRPALVLHTTLNRSATLSPVNPCVVCTLRSCTHVCVPCGHIVSCVNCSPSFGPAAVFKTCPICRHEMWYMVTIRGACFAASPTAEFLTVPATRNPPHSPPPFRSYSPTVPTGYNCTLCGHAQATHAYVPCGHQALCAGCAERIGSHLSCHICAASAAAIIQVYL
jgi:hypothetical protein